MNKKIIHIGLSCLISLLLAGWIQPVETSEYPRNLLEHSHGKSNPNESGLSKSSIIPLVENRQVVIDYPESVWVGDKDQIRMTLEYTGDGLVIPGNYQDFQELYNICDVIIETRLDLPGIDIEPAMPVQAALVESHESVFQWEIFPRQSGYFRGNLWLYLNLYPKDGSQAIHLPVLVLPVEIRVSKILGMPVWAASFTGWMGIALSTILLIINLKSYND